MDLTGLTSATIERLERIKELKKCDEITAIQYSIAVGWLSAERQVQKRKLAFPSNVVTFDVRTQENKDITEERIKRGGYNPAIEGPESNI